MIDAVVPRSRLGPTCAQLVRMLLGREPPQTERVS